MPAYFSPLRAVPSTDARGCRTSGCVLTAHDPHDLCEPCDAVYAMAFELYWGLVEREIARMEAETPGITDATRRAFASDPPTSCGIVRAGPPDPGFRQMLEAARVPIDWQVELLEALVVELRAAAIVTREQA